jgi:hypothetical protein
MCGPETDLTDFKTVGPRVIKKQKLKVAFLIDLKIRKFEFPMKKQFFAHGPMELNQQ